MTELARKMAEHTTFPVVFVPGILHFDWLRVGHLRSAYFRRLARALQEDGIDVHFPKLSPTGTVAERAAKLADYLTTLDARAVGLVGHSMGGLDCRYVASCLDRQRRIRWVVTVGTPHRGTPLATWCLRSRNPVAALVRRLARRALVELTPEVCARRNAALSDRDDVRYLSCAGARPTSEMPLWFRPWTTRLERLEGANDSQVSVRSANWGEFYGVVQADHLELAGWSLTPKNRQDGRPFGHISLYRDLIARAQDTRII